jgi:hypothetical protein
MPTMSSNENLSGTDSPSARIEPLPADPSESPPPTSPPEEVTEVDVEYSPVQDSGQRGIPIPGKWHQLLSLRIFCWTAIPGSAILFWYLYQSLVSEEPHLGPLLLSPSRTLLVVTILSQGTALLLTAYFASVFDRLRWRFVATGDGVSIVTFISLSSATSLIGIIKLLIYARPRRHLIWTCQRFDPQLCSID